MSRIDKSEGHHKMRTKDNELVNRIKLYIEEQIDRRGRMPTIRDIAEVLDVGKSSVQRYLEYMVEQGILARGEYGYESIEQLRTERTVSVAKLGYVPCGPLSEEYECIDGYVRLPVSFVGNAKKCFLLTASGNSMIDAGINDGDLVLVRQQEEANYNDIVVALKCFNCNHQEIAWKDETGMIRFVCPHCGTITISKEKSRRHIQIDMYAPKGEVLQSRIEY